MLLWELWAQNRKVNLFALVGLPFWVLIWNAIPVANEQDYYFHALLAMVQAALLLLPALFYLFYPVVVTSRAQEQAERHRVGFPERLYLLPLPSRLLGTLHLAACMLGVGAACLVLALTVHDYREHGWWYSFVLVTAGVCVLAIEWAFAAVRVVQVILAYVLMALVAACAFLPTETGVPVWLARLFVALTPVMFVAGWVTALAGLKADRHGAFRDLPSMVELFDRLRDRLPRRQPPVFHSPQSAQTWFESRYLAPLIGAFVSLYVFEAAFVSFVNMYGREKVDPSKAALFPLLFGVPFITVIFGQILAKSTSTGVTLEFGPFQATRPLQDAAFVRAKLRAGVKNILALVAMSAVLSFLLFLFLNYAFPASASRFPGAPDGKAPPVLGLLYWLKLMSFAASGIVLYLVTLWMLLSLSLTVMLTNSGAVILTTGLAGGVVLPIYLIAPAYWSVPGYQGYVDMVRTVTRALLATGLLLSVWALWAAVGRELVKARWLAKAAAVWVPVAVLLLVPAWVVLRPVAGRLWWECAVLAAAALVVFPLAPLALAPVALAKSRHVR